MSKVYVLTIFDDDGPEGHYEKHIFERSWEAVEFIYSNFDYENLHLYNFRIKESSTEPPKSNQPKIDVREFVKSLDGNK